MNKTEETGKSILPLIVYWAVVSLPLAWGVWKTLIKLPALFQ